MFLESPFSAGIVYISPLASISILLPVGEREAFVALPVTSSIKVSAHGKSELTVMLSCEDSFEGRSRRWR